MIVSRGNQYELISRDGNVLGTHPTYKKALAQEVAIEISKRNKMRKMAALTNEQRPYRYVQGL